MGPEGAVFHSYVVDGAGFAGHAHGEAGALEGGASGGGAGDHPVAIAHDNFPVGADVNHQCQFLQVFPAAGQQASHRVGTHKTGNHRQHQQRCSVVYMEAVVPGLEQQGFADGRIIGGVDQGIRGDGQEEVVHTGVADQTDGKDILPGDAG